VADGDIAVVLEVAVKGWICQRLWQDEGLLGFVTKA